MIPDLLKFHHLGLAASDPDRAKAFLLKLGYSCGEVVHDPLQNVMLSMCTHSYAPDVEVISPTETPGPLDAMLHESKHVLYHTCYSTEVLGAVLSSFEADGIRAICVSEPTPAVLFDGRLVSFYMIRGFGLIEILEL